jgi:hypothetical protein
MKEIAQIFLGWRDGRVCLSCMKSYKIETLQFRPLNISSDSSLKVSNSSVRVLPIDKNELNAKFGQKIIQYLFVTCF